MKRSLELLNFTKTKLDDEIPDNSPFRFQELTDRLFHDRRLGILWQKFRQGYSGAANLLRELDYRLGHGQNHAIIEIHGPPGIGKTMVAITLRKEANRILMRRGDIEKVHFELTLNYSQSTPAILQHPYSKSERVICIQDEDEELSGKDSERQLKAFRNLIKQGRKLGYILLKCNSDRDPEIRSKVSFAIEVWGQAQGWLICLIQSRTGYPLDFVRIKYPDKEDREWYEGVKDANMVHLQESKGLMGVDSSIDEENERVEEVYDATLLKYPKQLLVRDQFAQVAYSLYGKLGEKTCDRIKRLAWIKYKENGMPGAPKEEARRKESTDSKYTDEGFEENILQTLPEFHDLFQDDLYIIPPHSTEEGDNTDYPDVIGILKDGSIGIINAKHWAWRAGDVIRTHIKMKAEMKWYKILSRIHPDTFKVILFAKHKETGQLFIFEVPIEKAINGSYPIPLPKPDPASSSPNNASNQPSPAPGRGEGEPDGGTEKH